MTVGQADSTITMQDAGGRAQAVIEVKGSMARMSTPGQPDYVLYDASRDVVTHVNSERKEFTEIDRATLNRFSETVSEVQQQLAPQLAQMREQLKSLPPEQRAMIEQQMGNMASFGALETGPADPIELVKGGSDEVAGLKCQIYEVVQGQERLSQVCMATAADAGISEDDFATLTAMTGFMRDMASSAQKLSAGFGGASQLVLAGAEGVPVSVKEYKDGREYAVADVSAKAVDEARFNAYKSYRRQPIPTLE
jgi:TolA-binding protein